MSEIHTRLFLITPPISNAQAFLAPLKAALAGGRIDCLLLRTASDDEREIKRIAQMLAPMAQEQGAAVLLEPSADLRLAARAGADGLQIRYSEALLAEALAAQKPDRIIGVAGLKSRDDAMKAGEAGADYLMFGEAYPDGALPPFQAVLERVSWWAEIFSTPCVAYAPSFAELPALTLAKVEFIALEKAIWRAEEGPRQAVARALAEISRFITDDTP